VSEFGVCQYFSSETPSNSEGRIEENEKVEKEEVGKIWNALVLRARNPRFMKAE